MELLMLTGLLIKLTLFLLYIALIPVIALLFLASPILIIIAIWYAYKTYTRKQK